MKCSNCGKESTQDMKFCGYCGKMIKPVEVELEQNAEKEPAEVALTENKPSEPKKKTVTEKIKDKFLQFWHRIDLFCKVETIAIGVIALQFIIALCTGKVMPIIFSVMQLGGLIIALLFYKGKIKTTKKWLPYLILVLSILFTIPNLSSYSWFNTADSQEGSALMIVDVDTPYAAETCIGKNKDKIIDDFMASGFHNITEEEIEDLKPSEEDKYGKIESISINGITDFGGNQEFKSSAKVIIKYHSYKRISMPFSSEEVQNMDVDAIIELLQAAGFGNITTDEEYDLDPDIVKRDFENRITIDDSDEFEKGEKFQPNDHIHIVTHRPYEKHTLKIIVDFMPNLIFSTYDVEMNVNGHAETLTHGDDAEFEYRLKEDKYILTFTSTDSSSVNGQVEIVLTGDTEAAYKIRCYDDKVDIETIYVENQGAVGENEAMVPISASTCKFKNYKDIEKEFKDAGFTNIQTKILYDIVWGWTAEGEVEEVSVHARTDFNRGDVFAKDTEIVITYHMKEEDDPNKPTETAPSTLQPEASGTVFYSSNDYETATEGKTGVFSYKNKSGSYDVYWIIDFDEGFVYFFTEGNGENFCDKVPITSGTLNDRVTITWKIDGEKTDWYLHFKYVGSPVTLIVVDHWGVKTEFTRTNLSDALKLRDAKDMVITWN